jgi:PTH1 family peptidyl-tRNA hydrolase
MNESGKFVKKLISNHQPPITDHLIIVHDDLDIPLGKFRIDLGRGPKLHNGVESVENTLGTKDFLRVRIGVDNRQQTGSMDGESYVLKNFLTTEKSCLENSVFPKILSRLKEKFSL